MFALFAALCVSAWAGERPPAQPRPEEVVESRLLPREVKREVAALARTDGAMPSDESRRQRDAQVLAQGFLRRARVEGDPRLVAYAQAALAPWRERDDVPVDLVVVQATVLQSQHRFGEAVALLERALARQPAHVQGGLTLSTVRIVRGDLPGARRACEPLAVQAPQVARLCRLQVDGLTDAVEGTWAELRAIAGSGDPQLAGWAASLLGESLMRLGHAAEAERWLAQAATVSGDLYDALALVDALLSFSRPADALRALDGLPPSDAVLLRRFRALQLLKRADAASLRVQLETRLAAASAEEARLHARERALFHLWADVDSRAACHWAAENFAQQKEPIDLRIAAEAAMRCGNAGLLVETRAFAARSGLRDLRLERVLQGGSSGVPAVSAASGLAQGLTP